MKTREPGIYYAQREGSMYLSGSDWDGDRQTYELKNADFRKEPWNASNGLRSYLCIKVEIKHNTQPAHYPVALDHRLEHRKHRYRYKCLRCGQQTKLYATEEMAKDRWLDMPAACIIETATIIGEEFSHEQTH